MGGLNRRDRETKLTTQFDSSELAALKKKSAEETFDDGIDPPTVRIAVGTTPPTTESQAEAPLRARTTTAYDPLTTSLLAEVTRRIQTAELDPDDLDDAGEEPATPTASPRLIRRKP